MMLPVFSFCVIVYSSAKMCVAAYLFLLLLIKRRVFLFFFFPRKTVISIVSLLACSLESYYYLGINEI